MAKNTVTNLLKLVKFQVCMFSIRLTNMKLFKRPAITQNLNVPFSHIVFIVYCRTWITSREAKTRSTKPAFKSRAMCSHRDQIITTLPSNLKVKAYPQMTSKKVCSTGPSPILTEYIAIVSVHITVSVWAHQKLL